MWAPSHGRRESDEPGGKLTLCTYANALGLPALSVPVMRDEASGMPVGVQLIGARGTTRRSWRWQRCWSGRWAGSSIPRRRRRARSDGVDAQPSVRPDAQGTPARDELPQLLADERVSPAAGHPQMVAVLAAPER